MYRAGHKLHEMDIAVSHTTQTHYVHPTVGTAHPMGTVYTKYTDHVNGVGLSEGDDKLGQYQLICLVR